MYTSVELTANPDELTLPEIDTYEASAIMSVVLAIFPRAINSVSAILGTGNMISPPIHELVKSIMRLATVTVVVEI